MTNKFVAQFTISKSDFVSTLQPHIGLKTKKEKFSEPTKQTKNNIHDFIHALHDYEENESSELLKKLNDLVHKLDLSPIRLLENNDAVIFIPKNNATPIVCGGVLTWNFAATIPFMVCDPHSGQDGTIYAVTTQFLAGAKALLSNYFNPNVDDNPNFKGNPITPSNIRRFADPAHSNTTAFVPFVTAFVDAYPTAIGTVTHGMKGKPNFQLIANNDDAAHFISNGNVSFDALMTIALGLQNLPTNPNVVVVEGSVPGFVTDKTSGKKAALISVINRNSPIRLGKSVGDNSDCVGHMLNGSAHPFVIPKQSDRAFFVELGPNFRSKDSHLMKMFADAQAMAIDWYSKYEESIHNPWKLKTRFPDVYNDMSLYPKLFDEDFIKAHKEDGANPFATSQPEADVADDYPTADHPRDTCQDLNDDDIDEPSS